MKLIGSALILFVLLGQAWAMTTGKVKTYEEIERIDDGGKDHCALLIGIVTLDNDQVYNVVWQQPFKTEEQVKKFLNKMCIDLQDTIQISDKKVRWWSADYFEGDILHKGVEKEGRILFYGPFSASHVRQMGQKLMLTGKQMKNDGGLMAHDYLQIWFEDFNFNPLKGEWRLDEVMVFGQKWKYCGPYIFFGSTNFVFKRGTLTVILTQK